MNKYYLPKRTQTHADVWAALGWASFFPERVRLREESDRAFVVEGEPDWTDLRGGFEFLKEKPDSTVPTVHGSAVFDYASEKQKSDHYREMARGKDKLSADDQAALQEMKPHEEFRLYQTMLLLQGDGGAHKLLGSWLELEENERIERLINAAMDLEHRRVPDWDVPCDLLQLFNPHSAKGYARLKPDSTGRGDKTKDDWAEPFLEFMRCRGYFQAACPRYVDKDGENIRISTPVPANIPLKTYRTVVRNLRQEPIFGSAVKTDCVSVLSVVIELLTHSQELNPHRQIRGVAMTHYQNMGKARTVTAIEELHLPDWCQAGQVDRWRRELIEHRERIRRLDDSISEELELLIRYRRVFQAPGPAAYEELAAFLAGYGMHVFRLRGQNKFYHKQFSEDGVRDIMNNQYSELFASNGFREVALAIRAATVGAQTLKRLREQGKTDEGPREIRYDLLPELRRKKSLPDGTELLAAVSEFIGTYNQESARRLEMKRRTGIRRVSEADFADFVVQFEGFRERKQTDVFGSLLLAYATCKAERAESEADDPVVEEANEQAA